VNTSITKSRAQAANGRIARLAIVAIFLSALNGTANAETPTPAASSAAVASSSDGKYLDAEGNPTFRIDPDGKVDWYTYSGFLRYHSECHVCHGPDGLGSTYAPALADSVKTMDYQTFVQTVVQGRKNLTTGNEKVMPSFGVNKNVMCYLDDIYTYLRARGVGDLPRARPPSHDPKPQAARTADEACMGPE
jgi:methanol metabolism-related c-type cytochrome